MAAFKADGTPIATTFRITKEPKTAAVRATKAAATKVQESKTLKRIHPSGVAVNATAIGGTVRVIKDDKAKLMQSTTAVIQAVISDAKLAATNVENVVEGTSATLPLQPQPSVLGVQTSASSAVSTPQVPEGARALVRATDLKNVMKTATVATVAPSKPTRPSIIKKTIIKEAVPISAAVSSIMVGKMLYLMELERTRS